MQTLDWLPDAVCRWTPLPAAGLAAQLTATEAAIIAGVVSKRREHFAAGRACAHAALMALGTPAASLGKRADGAPDWPAGVSGSIAHCPEAAVAIVAAQARWPLLGIDIEGDRRLDPAAAAYVLTVAERQQLAELPGDPGRWALAAFSAKECVHKAVHPATGVFLEFHEVEIRFSEAGIDAAGRFRFQPHPQTAAARRALAGREWSGEGRRVAGCLVSLLAGR